MPDFKLVESPIDLPGPAGTIPAVVLVFECDKCRAHDYTEADAALSYGASCPREL
jgi:hypothetical protein